MNVLKSWQKAFKGNLCILASVFAAQKVRIRVVSYTRSRAAQARLVEFPQGYPVAAPGRSQHQYGLAADLSVSPKTALASVGQTWTRMGGAWSSADPVHFAFFNPSQWAQILAMCGGKRKAAPASPGGFFPPEMPPGWTPPGPPTTYPGAGWPIPGVPPTVPILPNIAANVPAISPVATTMVGSTASRGLVTIQSPVGPAVMVSVPVSTSVVPASTSRR